MSNNDDIKCSSESAVAAAAEAGRDGITSSSSNNDPSSFFVLLSQLPVELKCRMVSFLPPDQAMTLSHEFPQLNLFLSRLKPPRYLFRDEKTFRSNGNAEQSPQRTLPYDLLPTAAGGALFHKTVFCKLRMRWKNQARPADRRGQVYLVATKTANTPPTSATTTPSHRRMQQGAHQRHYFGENSRAIYTSKESEHIEYEDLEIAWTPQPGEAYSLWHKVGNRAAGDGGDGPFGPFNSRQQLYLKDCCLETIVFDDRERHWSRNYQTLHQLGALSSSSPSSSVDEMFQRVTFKQGVMEEVARANNNTNTNRAAAEERTPPRRRGGGSAAGSGSNTDFYPRMLLRVCGSLLREQQQPPPFNSSNGNGNGKRMMEYPADDLVDFLREHNLSVTESSLTAVQEIVQNDLDEEARLEASAVEQYQQQQEERERRRHTAEDAAEAHEDNIPELIMARMREMADDLGGEIAVVGAAEIGGMDNMPDFQQFMGMHRQQGQPQQFRMGNMPDFQQFMGMHRQQGQPQQQQEPVGNAQQQQEQPPERNNDRAPGGAPRGLAMALGALFGENGHVMEAMRHQLHQIPRPDDGDDEDIPEVD